MCFASHFTVFFRHFYRSWQRQAGLKAVIRKSGDKVILCPATHCNLLDKAFSTKHQVYNHSTIYVIMMICKHSAVQKFPS